MNFKLISLILLLSSQVFASEEDPNCFIDYGYFRIGSQSILNEVIEPAGDHFLSIAAKDDQACAQQAVDMAKNLPLIIEDEIVETEQDSFHPIVFPYYHYQFVPSVTSIQFIDRMIESIEGSVNAVSAEYIVGIQQESKLLEEIAPMKEDFVIPHGDMRITILRTPFNEIRYYSIPQKRFLIERSLSVQAFSDIFEESIESLQKFMLPDNGRPEKDQQQEPKFEISEDAVAI